jgi:hypothetical protein
MQQKFLASLFAGFLSLIPIVAQAATAMYPACQKPDASFQSFLQRFTDDKVFQRTRIFLPLVARSGDGVTADATIDLWNLEHIKNLKDPLIYSDAERKKLSLIQSMDIPKGQLEIAHVSQDHPEGDDIQLRYWFRKWHGCWSLAEFDDWGQ